MKRGMYFITFLYKNQMRRDEFSWMLVCFLGRIEYLNKAQMFSKYFAEVPLYYDEYKIYLTKKLISAKPVIYSTYKTQFTKVLLSWRI